MLPHGTGKLSALAAQCSTTAVVSVNGWDVDVWDMTASDVDLAVDVYNEVLAADKTPTDPVIAKLSSQGVDLLKLLGAPGTGLELVTRADIAECAAAASVIAEDGYLTTSMLMPNIPKMARRKSDSGVDVFDVKLASPAAGPDAPLGAGERLGLTSVKHTLSAGAAGRLRLDIQYSMSPKVDLSQTYLAAQLRVVEGRLRDGGMPAADAGRVFFFLPDFPDETWVAMCGVAVVDPSLRADMVDQMKNLPTVAGGHKFRIVTFPDLANVHTRCP